MRGAEPNRNVDAKVRSAPLDITAVLLSVRRRSHTYLIMLPDAAITTPRPWKSRSGSALWVADVKLNARP